MKKFVLRGLAVVIALLVTGVAVLYFTINATIASRIETATTESLGVDTTLGSFRISLFDEQTTVSDLEIDNPKGYDGRFLTLEHGLLGVALGSLFSDRIEIREFTLKDIDLNLVQRLNGSNLGTIIDQASGSPPAGGAPSDATDADERKFLIDQVLIEDVKVTFSLEPVTSERQPTKLTIDRILVRDVGRKENGVPLEQVTTIILHAIVVSAAKAAPTEIPSLLLSTMEGGLSSVGHVDLGGVQFDLGKGMVDVVGRLDEVKDEGKRLIEGAAGAIEKAVGIDSGKAGSKSGKSSGK